MRLSCCQTSSLHLLANAWPSFSGSQTSTCDLKGDHSSQKRVINQIISYFTVRSIELLLHSSFVLIYNVQGPGHHSISSGSLAMDCFRSISSKLTRNSFPNMPFAKTNHQSTSEGLVWRLFNLQGEELKHYWHYCWIYILHFQNEAVQIIVFVYIYVSNAYQKFN